MRRGHGVVALTSLAFSGCYAALAPDGAPCADNGACPDGQTCEANVCTSAPGGEGDDEDVSVPEAPFAPSNAVSPDLLAGATATLGGAGTIVLDSDTGEITRDGVTVRAAGVGIIDGIAFEQGATTGMFAASALTIELGATLRGLGSRSLVVLVATDIAIDGTLDVSAGICVDGTRVALCAGPGGGLGGYHDLQAGGCGPGGRGANAGDTGGGGGGFGQRGAVGGIEVDDGQTPFNGASGGLGGAIDACPGSTLEPLAGGSGGGAGGGDMKDGWGGDGGGGGGAIQLTAFGTLSISGTILAAGGGGGGGAKTGGGGGGSGGAILLEALAIDLDGAILAANGGGGGAGGDGSAVRPGELGTSSIEPAMGGLSSHASGGDGGARLEIPVDGAASGNDTGGGGGAVGAIRLRARALSGTAAVISPDASTAQL